MSVVLVALLDAHTEGASWARPWLVETLYGNLPGYAEGSDLTLRGWSVGAAWGNETLVQSRPIVRDRSVDPVDDLLRTPASCVIAAFGTQSKAGSGLGASPVIKLSRFRRWLGVRVGRPLPAERSTALRRDLPGFLERHQVDRSDRELVFLTFLAQLHAAGGLRKTYSPPELIRQALSATVEQLELEPPHNLMVSDGRTFAMMHEGGSLLSFEPPITDAQPRQRFHVTGERDDGRRTNLLLHSESDPPEALEHGGERVAPGAFSIDVRRPRAIER